jgi:hypothetical protein
MSKGSVHTNHSEERWGREESLKYYAECREMLWGLGQKFSSLVVQASVFATAVCAALVALGRDASLSWPQNLWVAGTAVLALVPFWWITWRYSLQAYELGEIMIKIEKEKFGMTVDDGALQRLRAKAPLFGHRWRGRIVYGYMVTLVVLILLTAAAQ